MTATNLVKAELLDGRVTVTMDGTAYQAVFYKHPNEPRLVAASGMAVDREAPISHKEFENLAWKAANAKARESGLVTKKAG